MKTRKFAAFYRVFRSAHWPEKCSCISLDDDSAKKWYIPKALTVLLNGMVFDVLYDIFCLFGKFSKKIRWIFFYPM